MTLFRRSNDIEVSISPEFDKEYKPGETPKHSGIYRCRGWGVKSLPRPQSRSRSEQHPRHAPANGIIRWRLAVAAQHDRTERAELSTANGFAP